MNKEVKAALSRGCKMFAISLVAASTTAITVLQQHILNPDGSLNLAPALPAASTAFLIALASGVLHSLEQSLGSTSEHSLDSPPSPQPPPHQP